MAQSGWAITCDSAIGQGATFRAYFPRTDDPLDAEAAVARPDAATSAGETVLLVEDDHAVRSLAVRVLEEGGYRVITLDPDSAMALCERGAITSTCSSRTW